MKNLRLISPNALIHDGGALGTPEEAMQAHPAAALEIAQAVLTYERAQLEATKAATAARLAAVVAEAEGLRLKYEAPALPDYLLVVEHAAPGTAADHAGILGYHNGYWLGDLLRAADKSYLLVQSGGLKVPGAARITSLSELTPEQARADLAAALAPAEAPPAATP